MQLEVGALMPGTVTGITNYGVFVDLGADTTGMVHISEVASTFVREIRDYVEIGQQVSVKILGIDDRGRVSLSMKQAEPALAGAGQKRDDRGGSRSQGSPESGSFDDMLSRFMQSSDEKMSELRRNGEDHRPRRPRR